MPTILLVRHATTPTTGKRLYGRKPGVDIDERGRAQAQATAAHLAGAGISAVYSSPMERAKQTAQPIARRHGLRVRVRAALNEVDYGDWTDRLLSELRKLKEWKVIQQTPSRFVFPAGESLAAVQLRMVAAIEAIAGDHGDKDVVAVVSHADPIRMLIAHYSGAHLDHFQRLVVAPASITTIHLGTGAAPLVLSTNVSAPLTQDPQDA